MIKSLNLHANSNKIAIIDNLAEFSYQDLLNKVDERLFLRSDTMFLGYLNHDENINQWFDSGDLVDIDKDGFLQILGRSKELINVAGNKLFTTFDDLLEQLAHL